jgi:DNA mismatch repair protein MutL
MLPESSAPLPRRPILRLPEALINRIAAGEVIERPAAAVKELVENAIDAGARRIVVALTDGGIARIAVTDDGIGMDAGSLALALQRHATSKLTPEDDLTRIATLGFRGEALPSIAAAARLAITSRPAGADSAYRLQAAGGVIAPVIPAAGPPGTEIVVTDLFFATPARRKFLKSIRAEQDHAEEVVRRLAFAAPAIAFRLELQDRLAFDLPAQSPQDRARALLGTEAAAALVPVDERREAMHLHGLAALPAYTRASATLQLMAVNGRPVADPALRTALKVAYRDVIAAGRHAVAALWLDLPLEAVDVNVHPAKTELRFQDPAAVRSLVIGGLRRALAAGAGVALPGTAFRPASFATPPRRSLVPPLVLPPGPPPLRAAETQLPLRQQPAARPMPPAAEPTPADQAHPLGAAVAQVLDTYILAVTADDSLVLVDQHAAHERLTHEQLHAQAIAGGVAAQPLLLPAVVDLPPRDAARLIAAADGLARLGLEIEAFGPGAVLVRAMPALLGAPEPAPLLRDLADELAAQDEATALEARLDAAIARLACHGSIRAGRKLHPEEMNALLRRMEATPRAATCSHGRPTFLKLSKADIETLFGRR